MWNVAICFEMTIELMMGMMIDDDIVFSTSHLYCHRASQIYSATALAQGMAVEAYMFN